MIGVDKLRSVQIKDKNGRFVDASFGQIEAGDVFRLFEPNGAPVLYNGKSEFTADSHARVNCDHTTVWGKSDHSDGVTQLNLPLTGQNIPVDVTDGQPG